MPAAVLIFIGLGSLAVDAGVAFLGEREVANLAASIANDAATEGIDVARFQSTGVLAIDPARVRDIAAAALARSGLDHVRDLTVDTDVVGTDVVVVEVRGRVRSLFARALPDGLEERAIGASAEATARRG
jgi:hypothetical protein